MGKRIQAVEWRSNLLLEKIQFFDCHCVLGRRPVIYPGSYHETKELVRKLKYYGIEGAMAYHSMAREYSPFIGNQVLLEEINGSTFFQGVWVVLPHHTGEFPEPSVLREEMKRNDIKMVRMFPSTYGFTEWCCGELFCMLEKHRIPLVVGINEIKFNDFYTVLSSHPEMKVILTDLSTSVRRDLYPLLKRFQNIYVETMGYKVFGGIEDFCRQFGAERLLFGTGMPLYSGGSAVGMILYAGISHEDKCRIAGENLKRLLGGVLES